MKTSSCTCPTRDRHNISAGTAGARVRSGVGETLAVACGNGGFHRHGHRSSHGAVLKYHAQGSNRVSVRQQADPGRPCLAR